MTTPDEQEQQLSPAGDLASAAVPDLPLEADEADVLDQATDAGPTGSSGLATAERDLPLEAPEADAAEQARAVPLDEDEHPA